MAQCPQGTTAGLVKWSSTSGYASTLVVDDESITSPPIALGGAFFMPGSPGNLDTMWVNSNGEVYLTDSALALTQPANGASFGINSIAEMRGTPAGASARVAVLGGDHQGSIAAGAEWSVTVDQSVPGEIRVTWFDMRRFANTAGDKFSFTGRFVLASGVVECSYNNSYPTPFTSFTGRYVGISIGNNVGTTTQVNSDLSAGPNSGVDGILYQNFTGSGANIWDLSGQTVTFTPNGTGGYTAAVAPHTLPPCAFAASYGSGCYNIGNSMYQVFVDSPAAKAALDGQSMTLTLGAGGYVASWNGGAGPAFVPPGGGATTLVFTDGDDGNVSYTPTFGAIPTDVGPAATINVSVNGILTLAAAANNNGDFSPAAADITNNTTAPNTAVYGYWRDMTLLDSVPNGTITAEEVGNMLYISWNAVECYALALVNPSTWQFQVNMTTGNITVVWVSLDNSANTSDTAVGMSLFGAGTTPGATVLATGLPVTLGATVNPLTLTATGRPVITLGGTGPSNVITLTATNVPEIIPTSGIGVGLLIFSLGQLPGGLDLGFIDMPGCRLYVPTLDVTFGFNGASGTQILFSSAIPQPLSPGLNFFAQALALFPPNSLPGGLNNFGGLMSNGVQLNFQNQ